ncbi:CHAT domain-containing protein [Dactylosporangium vinaceum]|uniref:CHAT domain-containing protein n=1 Tax=Dactylosporangium vinaceum TaxID=53362 RepID=A0ABV5MJV7_9ACTN|nr:CHAT domain-containing protein [Dactylosporangium vinaceum]UAB92715.1 CHAT domain-containing protein [Dactylosporangium vinaceum]
MSESPRDVLSFLAGSGLLDVRVREAAAAVLRDLPAEGGAGRVSDPAEAARGRDLARRIVERLDDPAFPDDLTPLRGLDDAALRRLLDRLLERLLDRARPDAALHLAVRRIAAVAEVTGGLAGMPAIDIDAEPRAAGAALSFVAADEVLLTMDRTELPRMLPALARVAPHVGRVDTDVAVRLGPDFRHLAVVRAEARGASRAWEWGPAIFDPQADGEVLPAAGDDRPRAPRIAHPLLGAPAQVEAAVPFFLEVGLSAADTSAGGTVAPGPLTLPPGDVDVTVSLSLNGFRMLGTVRETVTLHVVEDDPLPVEAVRIMAVDDPAYNASRQIQASFHIGGQLLGVAWRSVEVRPAGTPAPAEPHGLRAAVAPASATTAWTLDADSADAADLYLVVGEANRPDQLAWTVLSPRPGVTLRQPVLGTVGQKLGEFTANAYRNIDRRQADPDALLRDLGRTVAEAIPEPVWGALRAVGAGAAVMLATVDPYVPWELAQVPRDLREPGQDVLGGYARIGRWLTGVGRDQVKVPPARIEAATMAAVCGTYTREDLPKARAEAEQLRRAYTCTPVDATKQAVAALLDADPAYDIVHFAIHGRFDAFGISDGLLLTDGYLTSSEVGGVERFGGRLVFLNACQLGQANDSLGRSAGMAAAFTGLGVGAVLAPLWKVDDDVAYDIGTGFYQAVFAGQSPAAYLRGQRAAAGRHPSRLAYLFFGHPRLRVTWRGPVNPMEDRQ